MYCFWPKIGCFFYFCSAGMVIIHILMFIFYGEIPTMRQLGMSILEFGAGWFIKHFNRIFHPDEFNKRNGKW